MMYEVRRKAEKRMTNEPLSGGFLAGVASVAGLCYLLCYVRRCRARPAEGPDWLADEIYSDTTDTKGE